MKTVSCKNNKWKKAALIAIIIIIMLVSLANVFWSIHSIRLGGIKFCFFEPRLLFQLKNNRPDRIDRLSEGGLTVLAYKEEKLFNESACIEYGFTGWELSQVNIVLYIKDMEESVLYKRICADLQRELESMGNLNEIKMTDEEYSISSKYTLRKGNKTFHVDVTQEIRDTNIIRINMEWFY